MRRSQLRCVGLLALVVAACPLTGAADDLHVAAASGDLETLTILLDAGTPVDAPDALGTPLIWALISQQAAAARLLVERGATPTEESPSGWPPLVYAIKMSDVDLVKAMLANGADSSSGALLTPLAAAAEVGNVVIAELLLTLGADPAVRMAEDRTALHVAAETGSAAIVKLLVASGADVNALTTGGRPAIHYAVRGGHEDIAEFLRDAGAMPTPVESVLPYLALVDAADPEGLVALRCRWCHATGIDGNDQPEATLWDVVNRPIGSLPDAPITPALRAIGDRWDYETLNRFIARPTEYAPGTKMALVGIPDVETRASIILYLRSLSDERAPLP